MDNPNNRKTIPHPNPINILVAEDDNEDYLIFTLALEETLIAFKIDRSTDGEMLMRMLQENIPDILFLDLQMPCKDGHQCLTEIRANRRYDSLPIIVLSAMNDEKNVDKCYHGRSNFYAVKPNSIEELSGILARALNIEWKNAMHYPIKSEFVLRGNKDY